MGIQLGSNFDMKAALPLDSRLKVDSISERDAILEGVRYDGMIVYVVSAKTNFQLVGGVTNPFWQELSGSGGSSGETTNTGKQLLVNNSANVLNNIGDYVANCPGMIIEYFIYRKAGSNIRKMRGEIRLETNPDEAITSNKWSLIESNRSEFGGNSGITFSLTETDPEKSVLVVTLNDLPGGSHECKFYYKITRFNNDTGKIIILENNSINPIPSIGEVVADAGAIIVDYFCYRRTDEGNKKLRGKILMESNPDAGTNPDKWSLIELERSEGLQLSGISFSLDEVGTDKSVLVVTLDDMSGGDHRCDFYFNKTVLAN